MPAIISIVKSVCVFLTAAAAVFSASQINYPTATATTSNPELIKSSGVALKISQLRFSPDSKNLAVLAGDRFISNWPVAGGNPTASTLVASIPLTCLDWDPTGNQLFLGTSKSQILSCDPATLDIHFRIHSDIEIIHQIQVVNGSESLLTLGNKDTNNFNSAGILAQIWHEDLHRTINYIPDLHYISSSKQEETGLFALGASTGEIVLFNPLSDKKTSILAKLNSSIDALKWADNNLIASSEGTVHMIDSSNSQCTKSIQISTKPIRHVEISKDKKTFFLTTGNEGVQVRDLNSGDLIYKLVSLNEMTSSIALSPDGKTLAVGTCQGHVTLWNTSDFQIRTILPAGIIN